MRLVLLPGLFLLATALPTQAADTGVQGYWREPGGSVIHIAPCGSALCATLATIRKDAPSQMDIHNPDASQRSHRLCGLVIGRGFRAATPDHAEDGTLYDPKSGKTYHGEMTATGDQLALRGYVGIRLFGRTETWTRTTAPPPCA